MQILFQLEFAAEDLSVILKDYWSQQKVSAEIKEYSEWLVKGIWEHRLEIDRVIQQASKNWRLERMATVDRNILRIGVFEMLFEKNLEVPIVIDEAIEIAKKFSGQEAAVFVNGLLDGVKNNLQKIKAAKEQGQSETPDEKG